MPSRSHVMGSARSSRRVQARCGVQNRVGERSKCEELGTSLRRGQGHGRRSRARHNPRISDSRALLSAAARGASTPCFVSLPALALAVPWHCIALKRSPPSSTVSAIVGAGAGDFGGGATRATADPSLVRAAQGANPDGNDGSGTLSLAGSVHGRDAAASGVDRGGGAVPRGKTSSSNVTRPSSQTSVGAADKRNEETRGEA
ncbi:hypothetical protein B0H15DRAFT_455501 [Mycena belliarum]|uniref:Uncharacterized protein n=1 Tax=Mycena belliarum TaxID=1033014 RepID=A0AAD6UF41_9AGAR|nr:hypothetical protein B0H15DRAFT_455501 [Mycena belliae]